MRFLHGLRDNSNVFRVRQLIFFDYNAFWFKKLNLLSLNWLRGLDRRRHGFLRYCRQAAAAVVVFWLSWTIREIKLRLILFQWSRAFRGADVRDWFKVLARFLNNLFQWYIVVLILLWRWLRGNNVSRTIAFLDCAVARSCEAIEGGCSRLVRLNFRDGRRLRLRNLNQLYLINLDRLLRLIRFPWQAACTSRSFDRRCLDVWLFFFRPFLQLIFLLNVLLLFLALVLAPLANQNVT